jgi:GntR family transcriptional regulator, arabinose operon transcriptional repressor
MSTFHIDPNDPLPRYFQVFTSLSDRIRRGEFGDDGSLPPERQLVQEYAVSRITIVKALDLLERRGMIDRQHGRGTFVTSKSGASSEPRSIAFVSGSLNHPYLFNVLMGIVQVARRNHVHVQVVGAYNDSAEERRYIRSLIDSVSGVIVYPGPGYQNDALYQELVDRRFPLVMVDRFYPQVVTDHVVFDDEAAGYELTKSLLARSHERIAVLPHSEVEATSVRNRIRGFRRALEEHGIRYGEHNVWLDVYATLFPSRDQDRSDPTSLERLGAHLKRERPTALLTINYDVLTHLLVDLMMLDALSTGDASEPNALNLEIAAFSHQRPNGNGPYPISVALHSGEELGSTAAELLIGRIDGSVNGAPTSRTVPMQLLQPSFRSIQRLTGVDVTDA